MARNSDDSEVDMDGRLETAKLIRDLYDGIISNYEFEDRYPESRDFAIQELSELTVMECGDRFEFHMRGKYVASETQEAHVARRILFLEAADGFEWDGLAELDSIRLMAKIPRFIFRIFRLDYPDETVLHMPSAEVYDTVWPFASQERLDCALEAQRIQNQTD